jgi:Bacterial protein of unknown function (DUF899)
MGWTFPWASSFGGDFNFDFSVGFTEEQQHEEGIEYNYRREKPLPRRDAERPVAAIPSRTTPDGATLFAAMTGTDVATYTRERPGMSAFVLEGGVVPQPDGSLHATSQETWAVAPQDLLLFSADTTFTPIAGQPIGTVASVSTLTLIGGTGSFEGWSGELEAIGTGFNIFGPAAGVGSTYFDLKYGGTLCTTP